MLPDRVSNPGPLTYESGALPIALSGPALTAKLLQKDYRFIGYNVDVMRQSACSFVNPVTINDFAL